MHFDVNPRTLNRELARELKERKILMPPSWTPFVKTGAHRERVPAENDWWYHRGAAILRVVAVKGPIGTAKLTVRFGGRKNRGVAPDQFAEASGNIIRKLLQQLEKAGMLKQVERAGHKGRVITKNGTLLLKGAITRAQAMPAHAKYAPVAEEA